ncbi:hypothetical protein CWO01_14695 [Vibrio splendidus]|uniref:YfjI family protein n=1 Tax=Vibrio splendidus TaxID=29497 RepID=UPI000D3C03AA|nr:YfjI family protein [Vibrio splendidus]PTP61181.1 hypothetical protein CWO01_14695 [Vibrio splendidus]
MLYQFPTSSEVFPLVSPSSLITKAYMEAKLITQAPDSMVYMTAISSVSLALQGVIDVEIPTGKISPVSLMGLTIAESGERKSSVENLFTKGIKSFQKENIECYQTQLDRYQIQLDLHEKKVARIKKLVNLDDELECESMANKLLELEEKKPIKPKLNLITYEDSTIEALLSGLSENVPNAFLGSSEGGVLLNSRAMTQTASLNAIWSGDDVTVNRKTAGSYTVESARLTVHIMTQSSALDRFIKKSKDSVRGNGFLARLLVCAPSSNIGFRQSSGIDYSRDGIKEFNGKLYYWLSESQGFSDYTNRKIVRFSNEAKKIWQGVYNDIEVKMRPNGIFQQVADHASKLPENIARLAALIHCFDGDLNDEISSATLIESVNLISYFSGQFVKVFSAPPKCAVDAHNLMQWFLMLSNSGVRYIKRNDIFQFGPYGTRSKKNLEEALEYLKPNYILSEIMIKPKTRVIDFYPHYQRDDVKIMLDLGLNVSI